VDFEALLEFFESMKPKGSVLQKLLLLFVAAFYFGYSYPFAGELGRTGQRLWGLLGALCLTALIFSLFSKPRTKLKFVYSLALGTATLITSIFLFHLLLFQQARAY
jgi:hypothetical protein